MTRSRGSFGLRLQLAAAGALSISILIAGAGIALGADEDRIPLEDATTLVEPEDVEPSAIPRLTKEDALARARQLYGEDAMGATNVEAYLVSTSRAWLGTTDPVVDRPTWIVHLSGMGMVMAGPAPEEGAPVAANVVDDLYVFIAADTGEFLGGVWTE